jgi:hypothetical protein
MENAAPANNPAPVESNSGDNSQNDQAHDRQTQESKSQKQPKETPAQKERRLLKTKVNGREVEVDEETVLRRYSKEEGAEQKLREAAQMRKEVESFYETLLNDPEAILNDKRIPLKKRELAEKWLMEQLEEETKTVDPRDKRAMELEEKLKSYEEREAEEKTKAEQAEYQRVVDQRREAIATTLNKAIAESPLAQDPETQASTIKEMAMYMKLCRDAKYDVSPEEIAAHVEAKHNKTIQKLVGQLKGEKLIKYLGEDIINEVRRFDLAQLQKSRDLPPPQQADSWEPRGERTKREWIDSNELRRQFKG